jgi:hypothetical protein
MFSRKFSKIIPVVIALIVFYAGCSTARLSDQKAFAAPTHLTATLATPIDIDLNWQDNAANAAGYFVEYSPMANDEFDIITALPPRATKYRHPHLLPHTQFVFRVLPFFGPASSVAEIKTGKGGMQLSPTALEMAETNSPDIGTKKSIRSMSTFAKAAPTGFRATLVRPAGVKLDWVDHASDADGYLVEIRAEWSSEFQVSAFLPPHTTTLTSYGLPFDTQFTFRVRPFFYGRPSNLAGQTTGNDPSFRYGTWIKTAP